jgi:two-component system response regulator MprA
MWRVLVVDDEPALREVLKVALELEGYEVVTARDGVEALRFLESREDAWVVLLDVMMPRMDGLEVCHRLRETGWAARHRVVLMTAGLLTPEECPAPARALLYKPFELATLIRLVSHLAGGMAPVSVVPTESFSALGVVPAS